MDVQGIFTKQLSTAMCSQTVPTRWRVKSRVLNVFRPRSCCILWLGLVNL